MSHGRNERRFLYKLAGLFAAVVFSIITISCILFVILFVRYEPVLLLYRQGDFQLTEKPELISREHVQALKRILSQDGRFYITLGGRLYVTRSLARDRELLANYCLKAEGAKLREHENHSGTLPSGVSGEGKADITDCGSGSEPGR